MNIFKIYRMKKSNINVKDAGNPNGNSKTSQLIEACLNEDSFTEESEAINEIQTNGTPNEEYIILKIYKKD